MLACDKYLYFPSLGILMSLTAGLAAAWTSRRSAGFARKTALLLPVVALLALEARGVRQTLRHWTDSLTLDRHMERVAPGAPAVHGQLGVLLERAGAHDEAVLHLRRALELEPNYPDAHYNLGVALAAGGRLDESIRHFRTADVLLPDDPPTVFNQGMSLRLAGRLGEAAAQFRRLLRLRPDHVEAASELGSVLVAQGSAAEAADQFRGALALTDGRDPAVLDTRAAAEAALGRFEAAVETERRAVDLAVQAKRHALVAELRERLRLYQRRIAHVKRDDGGGPR